MHRGFYVATVLVPLFLGSTFLIFGIFSDYWIRLDYDKIQTLDLSSFNTETYGLKKVRFEFPKFSSLFDECNEYKVIEVLDPKEVGSLSLSSLRLYSEESGNATESQIFIPSESSEDIKDFQFEPKKELTEDKNNYCHTREECNNAHPNENGLCFCCRKNIEGEEKECCHPRSNLCDGVRHCTDSADELENCPLKKVFYSHSWYDNKNKCQRNQYSFFEFLKKALNLKERFAAKSTDNFRLAEILKSENFTVRIFILRLITLLSFGFCIIFTILCLITVMFVTCCNNLKDLTKPNSNTDLTMYGGAADDEEEQFNNEGAKLSSCCCKCNCLLCPFVFYSTFSILAFISHLVGIIVYVYQICYIRNAYLIFDVGFQPQQITKAYQYNPWLFGVQEIGVSFYAIMVSFVFYLIMFICSTCITCRIQMSPAWITRHTSSYEVLQMQDITFNNKKLEKKEKKEKKKRDKKEKKEKEKEKPEELDNVDEFSDNSGETQALTRPKTNIQAIDNSYE